MKIGSRVGTLEAGKLAARIVVDGHPLLNLSAPEAVEVVVQGGEVVAGSWPADGRGPLREATDGCAFHGQRCSPGRA